MLSIKHHCCTQLPKGTTLACGCTAFPGADLFPRHTSCLFQYCWWGMSCVVSRHDHRCVTRRCRFICCLFVARIPTSAAPQWLDRTLQQHRCAASVCCSLDPQATELMVQWVSIEIADAMELLSPDFRNEEVRPVGSGYFFRKLRLQPKLAGNCANVEHLDSRCSRAGNRLFLRIMLGKSAECHTCICGLRKVVFRPRNPPEGCSFWVGYATDQAHTELLCFELKVRS